MPLVIDVFFMITHFIYMGQHLIRCIEQPFTFDILFVPITVKGKRQNWIIKFGNKMSFMEF